MDGEQSGAPMAVVMAAGKGTRMESDLPKVLCRAAGKPLISYVLEALRAAGIGKIAVVVGYRHELVRNELADVPDLIFVEQTEQLGTGHAVMVCREVLETHRGPVVIVTGDSPMLQPESLRGLLDEVERTGASCMLGTLIHDDPTGLGRIVRDDEGQFLEIVEDKDCTEQQRQIREVNMSTYVMDCEGLLEALEKLNNDNQQGEYYITDVPGILKSSGHLVGALPVLKPCESLSVNTVEQLKDVEREIVRQNSSSDIAG